MWDNNRVRKLAISFWDYSLSLAVPIMVVCDTYNLECIFDRCMTFRDACVTGADVM